MHARGLSGLHIGRQVEYIILGRDGSRTIRITGELTMITHKKNGNVRLRHLIRPGRNADVELKAETPVEVLS